MPTLGKHYGLPPSPTESPATEGAPEPAEFSGEPLWTVTVPDEDDLKGVGVTGEHVVAWLGDRVVGMSKSGQQIWEFTFPDEGPGGHREPTVSNGVVFAAYKHPDDDRWPQPKIVVALDAGTGKELWRDERSSFWTAFDDVIYLSECRGGQDGELGECQLRARDVRTGGIRWSVPTHASASVLNSDDGGTKGMQARQVPPYLVVESFPTGYESRIVRTRDPASGRQLGAGFDGHNSSRALAGVLLEVDDSDDNPADGCTATVRAYAVTGGALRWERTFPTEKSRDRRYCADPANLVGIDGTVGIRDSSGRPQVLNAASGETIWTAPETGSVTLAGAGLLVATEPGAGGTHTLVRYDLPGGTQRWRTPASSNVRGAPGAGALLRDSTEERTVRYDLDSGTATAYPGQYSAGGEGWLVTRDSNGNCTAYPTP